LDTYCLIATSTGEIMNKVCKRNFPANVPPMTTHNKTIVACLQLLPVILFTSYSFNTLQNNVTFP